MNVTGKPLAVGWIIPTIGIFGAVREMIELSNVLVSLGVRVTVYHPDGKPCKWLPCRAKILSLAEVSSSHCDLMIGIVDWKTELYDLLVAADAKHKAICLLGFDPTEEMVRALLGTVTPQDAAQRIIRDAMARGYSVLADSSWQVEWFQKEIGYPAGPVFGGINLSMFNPGGRESHKTPRVIYSNDPRSRKGTDTVMAAIKIIEKETKKRLVFDSYWGRNLTQAQLVDFYRSGDIFLDGHRRAGWCNPVAEAIACGAVPVCTDIGAVRDFALNEETALVVPVDDAVAMAAAALRLLEDSRLRERLAQTGWERIQHYSYTTVGKEFEVFLRALPERVL